jgi:hypothetical protein
MPGKLFYGRDPGGTKYFPLNQINAKNGNTLVRAEVITSTILVESIRVFWYRVFGSGGLVGDARSEMAYGDVLLIARPALHGVLPAAVCPKILTAHDAFRKVPESVRAGAVFSSWIRILGRNGSPVFALEPIPIFLGCSQHPFSHACGGYRVPLLVLRHSSPTTSSDLGRKERPHFSKRPTSRPIESAGTTWWCCRWHRLMD